MCGSCWAFSATAAIEAAHYLSNGKLLKLSEQQFVDCANGGTYGNRGCGGGDETVAMEYAMSQSIELEETYPYDGLDGDCMWHNTQGVVSVTKVNKVPSKDYMQLLAAIARVPTTVAIEADIDFQFYKSGILNKAGCGSELNHAMIAVGYNNPEGFYIVRNSWGADWGEDGYIRIAITEGDGICGIQVDPSWPETD